MVGTYNCTQWRGLLTCLSGRAPLAQTSISLPIITATADGPKHIETNLSRAKFEELAGDLLDRCRVPVEQALKDANLSVKDLNEVILVGGSTRIPAVQVPPPALRPSPAACTPACMPRQPWHLGAQLQLQPITG